MTKSKRRPHDQLRDIAANAPAPPGTNRVAGNMAILAGSETEEAPNLLNRELWAPIMDSGDFSQLTRALNQHITIGPRSIADLQDHTQRIAAKANLGNQALEYLRLWFAHQRASEIRDSMRQHVHQLMQLHLDKISAMDKRIRGLWREFPATFANRLSAVMPEVQFSLELDDRDKQLVKLWGANGAEDQNRLEAARHGERAALDYYRALGQDVEDVSMQQLDGREKNWKKGDLRASGRLLDIKNIRCPRQGQFAEHYWRKQKQEDGMEVPIVGVVRVEDVPLSLVVGELAYSDLSQFEELIDAYESELPILLNPRSRERFVPGWLFEYPSDHYATVPDWRNMGYRWVALAHEFGMNAAPFVYGLAAAHDLHLDYCPREAKVLRSARRFFKHFGLSRRTVYL